jgi:hypothetical protein
MSRMKLPRPGEEQAQIPWRGALGALRQSLSDERQRALYAARWVESLPRRAQESPLADPDPGPPPAPPDMQEILAQARARALKVGAVTAGVAVWKESWDLYQKYQQGEPITTRKVFDATVRVGRRGLAAGDAASRRYVTIVSLDSVARVLAWQSARRASKSAAWKLVHVVSKNLAGRMGAVLMAAEVFQAMRRDIARYRDGDLSEQDLYRNCALTGVSIAAPLLGAAAGPVGGTVGLAVSVGAGMLRK